MTRRTVLLLGASLLLPYVVRAQPVDLLYANHPLAQGLRAWYPVLPQLSGGRQWYDLVGRAHGTLINMSAATRGWKAMSSGRFAGAVRFEATGSSQVTLTDAPFDFEYDQPFSIACWLRTPASTAAQDVISKYPNAGNFEGYGLYITSDGEVTLFMSTVSGAYIQVIVTAPVDDDRWHHIAATYSGSTTAAGITFYVDGILAATYLPSGQSAGLGESIANNYPLTFGANAGLAMNFWNGDLSDVALYTRVLAPQEVQMLATRYAPTYGGLLPSDELTLAYLLATGIQKRIMIQ